MSPPVPDRCAHEKRGTRLPSFLMAGFEGADHRNSGGRPVEMLDATLHSANVAHDYLRMRALGIRVVRESVGWRRSERGGRFDFSCAKRRAEAARAAGLTVLWTLWHYGWPDDLSLDDDALPERFARFARAAATVLADPDCAQPIFTPVNEISFLAWAVSETALIFPHRGSPCEASTVRGYALKRRLVRAALAGCDAIREVIPGARMLHVDPLIRVVPPCGNPARSGEAARVHAFQFQAWDMLAGRLAPELGGAQEYLDLVGLNYYHANQFELDSGRALHWHLRDARRVALRALLHDVFMRYGRTLVIAETSHFGIGRDRWLCDVASEVREAMQEGVSVAGLCLYPINDRPDWEHPEHWHRAGLWDRRVAADGTAYDQLNLPYLRALRQVQHELENESPEGAAHDDNAGAQRARDAKAPTEGARDIEAIAECARDAKAPTEGARDIEAIAEFAMIVLMQGRFAELPLACRRQLIALGARWRMLLVETARFSPGTPRAELTSVGRNLHVMTPWTPIGAHGSDDEHVAAVVALLQEAIASLRLRTYGAWLRTPRAWPILEHLAPDVIVYEPPGEADRELRPHPQFRQRHRALLTMANVCNVRAIEAQVAHARRSGLSAGARAVLDPFRHPLRARSDITVDCLILGAGLAGLSAAFHCGDGSLLVERESTPGGSRRSVVDNGYRFDFAPTVIDGFDDDDLSQLYERLLGDNLACQALRVSTSGAAVFAPSAFAQSSASAGMRERRGTRSQDARGRIGYPLRGGMQALIDAFLPLLTGECLRRANVVRIRPAEHLVLLDDGRRIRYRRLIATIPLPALIEVIAADAPACVTDAGQRLRTQALRVVNIGIGGTAPSTDHWIVFPAAAVIDRVVMQGRMSRHCNPAEGFGIGCEIPYSKTRPLLQNGTALIAQCIADCIAAGLIASQDRVRIAHEIDTPVACVIDDDPDLANVRRIEAWLARHDIAFTGNRGAWETGRCADALRAGRRAARAACGATGASPLRAASGC